MTTHIMQLLNNKSYINKNEISNKVQRINSHFETTLKHTLFFEIYTLEVPFINIIYLPYFVHDVYFITIGNR